ncbi:hypothetical protein Syun_029365 [Stephania yunnanensis]|uniref:Uncharacterized protein n=1 Tax=Stephania yunnanensis TaxID=152371 RepID=A0AAP0HJS5_9MAGN
MLMFCIQTMERLKRIAHKYWMSFLLTRGTGLVLTATADNSQQYREEGMLSQEVDPECPARRELSLQRYLEKRKDRGRFKCKKKVGASSCSSFEMYLSHQIRGQNLNEQSSRSGTSSPTQPRQLHTPSNDNALDDRAKTIGLAVDLNDSGAFQDDSLTEIPETLEISSM